MKYLKAYYNNYPWIAIPEYKKQRVTHELISIKIKILSKACTIEFTGYYQGQEHCLQTYENEYINLMVLLKDKICPEDFGQCGGMGRCGTCLVNVSGLSNNPADSYKNEQATLSKMGMQDQATRLSCQIQIDEDLKNAV
ncbi:MAG: 2Fe-2S iron-sulfur cluster-binding protein, partial [Flavitalea sp.]